MNKYLYDGPVLIFDTCVSTRWQATTYAISERKARSNFIYQFKKQNNRTINSKITLPGKVIIDNQRR